jgi:hypothetical protein
MDTGRREPPGNTERSLHVQTRSRMGVEVRVDAVEGQILSPADLSRFRGWLFHPASTLSGSGLDLHCIRLMYHRGRRKMTRFICCSQPALPVPTLAPMTAAPMTDF